MLTPLKQKHTSKLKCAFVLNISEILYSVKGLIICVVKIISVIHGSTAKENNIISLNRKINVLEPNLIGIGMTVVDQITHNAPILRILT